MSNELLEAARSAMDAGGLVALTLSRPCAGCAVPLRQTARPVEIRGVTKQQWSWREGPCEMHANYTGEESFARLSELFPSQYRNVHLRTVDTEIEARTTSAANCD
ncbi:MAG: hypothetical protein R3B90_11205 [Planctomycetaceae bacterium]